MRLLERSTASAWASTEFNSFSFKLGLWKVLARVGPQNSILGRKELINF